MAKNNGFREHARRWAIVAAGVLGIAGIGASYLIWRSVDGVAEQARVLHEEPGFAVFLPGTPTEESTSEESGTWGTVEVHRLVLEPDAEGPSYRVESYEYPVGALEFVEVWSQGGTHKLVVASGRALADQLRGEVVSEIPISLRGYPGNEVTIDGLDGHTTIARIYLVGHSLYRLIVTTPSADASREEIWEFFDSFRLLEPSASEESRDL